MLDSQDIFSHAKKIHVMHSVSKSYWKMCHTDMRKKAKKTKMKCGKLES
jgi:hypothetical protein